MYVCQSASCFSVSSLVMPYDSWILPARGSRLPAITSSWSSVSLPHFSLTLPLNCFQLPSMRSQFMSVSFTMAKYRPGRTTGSLLQWCPRRTDALCTLAHIRGTGISLAYVGFLQHQAVDPQANTPETGAYEPHENHRHHPDRGRMPRPGVRRLQLHEGHVGRETRPDRTEGRGKGTRKRPADRQRGRGRGR